MSLRELYTRYTREEAPPEHLLREQLLRLWGAQTNHQRRTRIVIAYTDGQSMAEIAKRFGIGHEQIETTLRLSMLAIQRAIKRPLG